MTLAYLAGAMEHTPDGASWRQEATKLYAASGVDVFDPYVQEPLIFGEDYFVQLKTLDKFKDYDLLHKKMGSVVFYDLNYVANEADFLLVKYDQYTKQSSGTHAEISMASFVGKPVHVWLDGLSIKDISLWSLGCFTSCSPTLDIAVARSLTYEADV